MAELRKAFPKAVRVVFKHYPLPNHRQAHPAHVAAQAVFALKGSAAFWKFHDRCFANSRDLTEENFVKWAGEVGVDPAAFKKALASGKAKAHVDADMKEARQLGIRGVPAFYINGRKLAGLLPPAQFKRKVNEALKKAEAMLGKGVKLPELYANMMKKAKARAVYK